MSWRNFRHAGGLPPIFVPVFMLVPQALGRIRAKICVIESVGTNYGLRPADYLALLPLGHLFRLIAAPRLLPNLARPRRGPSC